MILAQTKFDFNLVSDTLNFILPNSYKKGPPLGEPLKILTLRIDQKLKEKI